MKQYVITISRQFASMGRSIAQQLAKQLAIDFYDRDIVEETARRMGLPVSHVSDKEESGYFKRMYPLGIGLKSEQDEIFMIQSNIIRDLAKKHSCIIVGRCAESVLKCFDNVLNVYVYAPYEKRFENCTKLLEMDEATAKKMLVKIDASRAAYRKKYTGETDNFSNRQVMLDSGYFGIDGAARLIAHIAKERFAD